MLFPLVRRLCAGTPAPAPMPVGRPIAVMLAEHDRAGGLLARLRALTDGYTTPDDGCASWRAFYTGLAELEADTHLHVHKENNLLVPAVVARETALAGVQR